MKKSFLFIFSLLSIGLCTAQIGVNTDIPISTSILHVDGSGDNNTTSPTKSDNDVIVSKDGNVGIGTLTPQAKVDVHGTFRYVDGNQQAGRLLRSDGLGNALWQDFSIIDIAIWNITSNGYQSITTAEKQLSGTLSITKDTGIGLSNQTATSSVVVPAGRYIIFISSDLYDDAPGITINENGWFRLYQTGNSTAIFSSYYSMQLSGNAAYLETSSTVSLYPTFTSVNDGLVYFNQPPFSTKYNVTLTFMRI